MPEINHSNFYDEISLFQSLPGAIDEVTINAFKRVYGSDEAAKAKNIIYMYVSEKPIPRLVGESNILYIGQTKSSFKTRRYKDAKLHASSKANSLKFSSVIDRYGPITIKVCDYKRYGDTLLEAEGQLLWWYFQNHSEYPPINYTKTTNRNDFVKT